MTTCTNVSTGHDGRDVRLVKLYMRPAVRPMCAGCRAVLTRMGMDFTIVDEDRRPEWIRRDNARDFTSRIAA